MSTGLTDIMKRAAMEAMNADKPCDLRYGEVISTSPLRVKVSAQFIIPEKMLIVPKHLTDYEVAVSMDWTTESVPAHTHTYSGATENKSGGTSYAQFESHNHDYSGTTDSANSHAHALRSSESKTIKIHGRLNVGDKVALIRQHGGQKYYILDRI